MTDTLEPMTDDWQRLLAVVAHPDDLEYGAVARWTGAGKEVAYVIATEGEAGIDAMAPAEAGPIRRCEQVASARVVGVEDVTFLGHRDGVVEAGLGLRRDLARQVRRFRPDVLLTATYDLTYGLPGQSPTLNQADRDERR